MLYIVSEISTLYSKYTSTLKYMINGWYTVHHSEVQTHQIYI